MKIGNEYKIMVVNHLGDLSRERRIIVKQNIAMLEEMWLMPKT
jgi:hypothetical protein